MSPQDSDWRRFRADYHKLKEPTEAPDGLVDVLSRVAELESFMRDFAAIRWENFGRKQFMDMQRRAQAILARSSM